MSQPGARSRYLGMDAHREHSPTPAPERSDSSPGRPPPGKVPITARLAPRTVVLRHGAGAVDASAGGLLDAAAGGSGAPLPDGVRARFEQSLGHDLAGVRVHTDGPSATAAAAIGARAYAVGQDVHFADGEYRPDDPFGLHLLAHEVVHTVQQTGGAAARAPQPSLAVSSPGDAFEREAEALAPAVARGEPVAIATAASSLARTVMRAPSPGRVHTAADKGKLTVAKGKLAENIVFGPLLVTSSVAAEVSYERVTVAPPPGGATTTAQAGGRGPNTTPDGAPGPAPQTDARSGVGGDASKGAVGMSQEIKYELEQGVRQQMLGIRTNFTEASEITTKSAKFGGSLNVETKLGPVPLKLKVIELLIAKWDATANPPVKFLVAVVGEEVQLAEFEHVTADGTAYRLRPSVKVELEFSPDPVKIGKFVVQNIARVFASELALAGGMIAAGAATIFGSAYLIAHSGDITAATEAAVRTCRTYCRAYEAAIKGGKPVEGDGAAAGTQAGKAWVAARQLIGPDSNHAIATAAKGLNLYQDAWRKAWPQIKAKAIADYWAEHRAERFVFGEEGAGSGGFRTFKRVLDAAGDP